MEIVSPYSHLGHIISSSDGDSLDMMKQKRSFNGQVNNMLCFWEAPARGQITFVRFVLYELLWMRAAGLNVCSVVRFLYRTKKRYS